MVSNNKWDVLKLFSKSQDCLFLSVSTFEKTAINWVMFVLFCWYKYIDVFRGNGFTVAMVVLMWLELAGNDNIPIPRDMIKL